MSTEVKKVGGNTAPKVKKEKTPRPVFDLKTAVGDDNKAIPGRTDGKLQGVPTNFVSRNFKPLKATDFADRTIFMDFKAWLLEESIKGTVEKAAALRKQAKKLRAMGDDATRKKASKLMKQRESLAALEAELKGDGFDFSVLED
ncbi:MAG: hypothetical protein COA69_09635 [Robiginitomaculum sp.]|nr:MAG: hypothetical protein COA69_09635 [Robiginitomaculum sp.]